jgi:hypothetical protein
MSRHKAQLKPYRLHKKGKFTGGHVEAPEHVTNDVSGVFFFFFFFFFFSFFFFFFFFSFFFFFFFFFTRARPLISPGSTAALRLIVQHVSSVKYLVKIIIDVDMSRSL